MTKTSEAVRETKATAGPRSLTADSGVLTEAVTLVARAAGSGRGGMLASFQNVHVTASNCRARLRCTDIEVQVEATVRVAERHKLDFVVPAVLLRETLKVCPPGEVALIVGDGEVTVKAGEYQARIQTALAEAPPTLAFRSDEGFLAGGVDAHAFLDAIDRVLPAVSDDDARPILTSVYFGGASVVGTDSFRLAQAEIPESVLDGELLPSRLARMLQFAFDGADQIEITRQGGDAKFEADGKTVFGRLHEGQFPNYKTLIPDVAKAPTTITVDRRALIAAVKRCKPIIQRAGAGTPVRVLVADSNLSVESVVTDVGMTEQPLPVEVEGVQAILVGANPDFLLAGLGSFDGDDVKIAADGGLKPFVVHDGDPDRHLYLQMPVRLTGEAAA